MYPWWKLQWLITKVKVHLCILQNNGRKDGQVSHWRVQGKRNAVISAVLPKLDHTLVQVQETTDHIILAVGLKTREKSH